MTHLFDRALLGLGAVGLVAAVVALFAIPHPLGPVIAHAWVWGAVVPAYVVGVFAVVLRPEHRSAQWLGRAGALLAIETAGRRYLPLAGDVDPGWWLAGSVALQFAVLATTAAIASVLVVFPDESLRYRYQRRVLGCVWGVAAGIPVLLTLSQPTLFFPPLWFGPAVDNPVFVPWLAALGGMAERAFDLRSLLWAAGVVAMAVRYRRESSALRPRFFWPLTVGCVLVAYDLGYRVAALVTADGVGSPLLFSGWVPGLALLSLSMLVAILRHRLIGASLWLRRSVLFGGATAIIALAFLGLAGVLGMAVGQRVSVGVGVVATLVAVVASQPARRRLDDLARRWVFGGGVSGSELLRRAGVTLEDAYDVGQLSANLADTVVTGLRLEWVRVSLSADAGGPSVPVAAAGIALDEPAAPDLVVPLGYANETVGCIECGPKHGGELSSDDEQLLETVGRQAALAVRNARLTVELESRLDELRRQADELAASRSRIVQAQLDERRRIERNIHDGVQQDVVAALARLRLARNQLPRDPQLAAATLADLQEHIKRTLESIRELGSGIHPAVLTNRGINDALDAQAARLPIDVRLDVAAEVRTARYTEEVETVAYFVVSEGLANVLKHAATGFAVVRLRSADGWLTVEVIDHGRGSDPEALAGSGIVGLRDRVESIGGRLTVDTSPGRGLVLRALLPARRGAASHV